MLTKTNLFFAAVYMSHYNQLDDNALSDYVILTYRYAVKCWAELRKQRFNDTEFSLAAYKTMMKIHRRADLAEIAWQNGIAEQSRRLKVYN